MRTIATREPWRAAFRRLRLHVRQTSGREALARSALFREALVAARAVEADRGGAHERGLRARAGHRVDDRARAELAALEDADLLRRRQRPLATGSPAR